MPTRIVTKWVDGVGWCVRVRVDPQRRASTDLAVPGDMDIRGRSNIDEGLGAPG